MTRPRILVYGNSGSGKTTMARVLAREHLIPHLSLDDIAWSQTAVRKPFEESLRDLEAFWARNDGWVIEGCYGELIDAALTRCSELRFLNPGVEACLANCRRRPWEPDKYPSLEAQNEFLEPLLEWVRQYETRDDEFSLRRHQEIFDRFEGSKRIYGEPSTGQSSPVV